jgi:hypothetical protein
MYADDGTYGTTTAPVNWHPDLAPTTRSPSTVILYFPVQEGAGAYLTRDYRGTTTDLTPCDVYIKYSVRVDVLTTHLYTLQLAEHPQTLAPPIDYTPYEKGFWDSLGDIFGGLGTNWTFWIILIVVVMVLVTVLNPGMWASIVNSRRKDR